jgi:hypothetical protein
MTRASHYVLLIFGFILAGISFWLIAVEVSRSGVAALPSTQGAAAAAAGRQGQARRAALLGGVRGEQWSQLAYTYAILEWPDPATPGSALDEARHSATRALTLKPINASVWLLLADFGLRYGRPDPSPIECLKMSYYTGPHEEALVPLRLAVTSRFDISTDPELGRLFRRELENVLSYRPALRAAIVSAYGQATPQAQLAIESAANDIDPSFAKTLPPKAH